MAASGSILATGELKPVAKDYQVEKWFYDYAESIEAVNLHYACTPLGEVPDWKHQRVTRFMPLVDSRMRRKVLKLPAQILDPNIGEFRDRYLLHHYFEIFADGDKQYSPLYTEEVATGAGNRPGPVRAPASAKEPSSDFSDLIQPSSSGGSTLPANASPSSPPSKTPKARSTTKKGKR